MQNLSPEEIVRFAKILSLPESAISTMNHLAVRLMVGDAEIQKRLPDYQPAMTPEQIGMMFPNKRER